MDFLRHRLIQQWLWPQIIIIDNYGNRQQLQQQLNKLQMLHLSQPTSQLPMVQGHQESIIIIITIIIVKPSPCLVDCQQLLRLLLQGMTSGVDRQRLLQRLLLFLRLPLRQLILLLLLTQEEIQQEH
jgi:hypothetical protein